MFRSSATGSRVHVTEDEYVTYVTYELEKGSGDWIQASGPRAQG